MVNKPKAAAAVDGKAFLREALEAEQKVLATQLELSAKSITHNGLMGEVNEDHFIDFLRKHLPSRYEVDSGIVIDSRGASSDQIDVIIFDHHYTPTLLDQQAHRFIPAEAVYCVLEVKPTINKEYLEYAADKAYSVRQLERTSVAIPHAGGQYAPKPLFQIVAGIVASNVSWTDGLTAKAFATSLNLVKKKSAIDCGMALCDRAFDNYDDSLKISRQGKPLPFFLFRLLHRLQSLGTVPAVDWNKYAGVLTE